MRAMVLDKPAQLLQLRDVPKPKPGRGQLLVRISACAVCRTDLHVVDGELPNPKLPLILGHQIVARVEEIGEPANFKPEISNQKFAIGDRVGIPWLGWTDGYCAYCRSGRENLCDNARFTGYTIDGGYAEFTVADARFCFHLPERYDDVAIAPLLCAGLIGYRCYRKTGDAHRLGIYGFGNAANLIAQIALHEGRELFVFTRPGDKATQASAEKLGAIWAGGSDEMPPEKLDANYLAAPGTLSVDALRTGWRSVLARVRPYDKMAEALLRDAEPIKVEGDLVVLGFYYQGHAERFEKQPNGKAMIEKALAEIFQTKCRVKCVLSPKKARLKAVEEDPLIRAAINQMGAEITEIHDQER